MEKKNKKPIIALYGGSFNPIHNGHVLVAKTVSELPEVEKLYVGPTVQNPLKSSEDYVVSYDDRLMMTMLALKDYPEIEITDIERQFCESLGADYVYSIQMLDFIKNELNIGDYQLKLVVGVDCCANLRQWLDWKRLLDEYGLIIVSRAGVNETDMIRYAKQHKNNIYVELPEPINWSSSEIRNIIKNGGGWTHMIPKDVVYYILNHDLYNITDSLK